MFLFISLGLLIIYVILRPYTEGLYDTSLWIAKITLPDVLANASNIKQMVKTYQAALLHGWPSNFPFTSGIISVASIVTGFLFAWWYGIISFLLVAILGAAAKFFFTKPAAHYIHILYVRMLKRAADYRKKNDIDRAEASDGVCSDLNRILLIYLNSRIKAPTPKQLKSNPYGDIFYWIESIK